MPWKVPAGALGGLGAPLGCFEAHWGAPGHPWELAGVSMGNPWRSLRGSQGGPEVSLGVIGGAWVVFRESLGGL